MQTPKPKPNSNRNNFSSAVVRDQLLKSSIDFIECAHVRERAPKLSWSDLNWFLALGFVRDIAGHDAKCICLVLILTSE